MDRYKVKYKIGNTLSFSINLKMGDIDLTDLKEAIDDELNGEKDNSINSITSGDVVRYRPALASSTLTFLFNGIATYISAGFTSDEITSQSAVFTNSNYVFQVYDSYDSTNQTLLHTGYLNGFSLTGTSSVHTLSLNMESFFVYLSESYLETITASTFTLYFRILYYNAKTGTLIPFTQNSTLLNSELQLYFPFLFTKTTKRYDFPSSVTFKQLPTSQYTDIVNQTVQSVNLQKPVYPVGNTFTVEGDYSQTD